MVQASGKALRGPRGPRRATTGRLLVALLALLAALGLGAAPGRGGSVADSAGARPLPAQPRAGGGTGGWVQEVDDPYFDWEPVDSLLDIDRNRDHIPDFMEAAPYRKFKQRPARTAATGCGSTDRARVYAYPPRGTCATHVILIVRSPCADFTAGVQATLRDPRDGIIDTLEVTEAYPGLFFAASLYDRAAPAPNLLTIVVGREEFSRVVTLGKLRK